jgi:hypothetical protein
MEKWFPWCNGEGCRAAKSVWWMAPRGVAEATAFDVVGYLRFATRRPCTAGKAEDPIDPQHVQIRVQGSVLTITGLRRAELTTKEAEYFHEEFSSGEFERNQGKVLTA